MSPFPYLANLSLANDRSRGPPQERSGAMRVRSSLFLQGISMSFDTLGLKPELLRAVADKGYTVPTPIQIEAIPAVLSGRDVLAGAQTGTGKTAGFTLPLLQKLGERGARNPRALVLTPTRELAAQVEQSIQDYG